MKDSQYLNKLVKRTFKKNVIFKHKLKKIQHQLDMIKEDFEYESIKWNSKEPQNINKYKYTIFIVVIVISITIKMIYFYNYKQ